jgi:hypothetical protein
MGNRPLIPDNRLSWIRDTTADDTEAAKSKDDQAPKQEQGKPAREPQVNATTDNARQPEARYTPEPAPRREPAYSGRQEPDYYGNSSPSYEARQETRQTRQASERAFREDQTPTMRYMSEPLFREREDPPQPARQAAPQAGPERSAGPGFKKPGRVHYWLSIVALICVAIAVPDRYSTLIFLGFIFIILMEISYRIGQQIYLNRVSAENMNTLLKSLTKTSRGTGRPDWERTSREYDGPMPPRR